MPSGTRIIWWMMPIAPISSVSPGFTESPGCSASFCMIRPTSRSPLTTSSISRSERDCPAASGTTICGKTTVPRRDRIGSVAGTGCDGVCSLSLASSANGCTGADSMPLSSGIGSDGEGPLSPGSGTGWSWILVHLVLLLFRHYVLPFGSQSSVVSCQLIRKTLTHRHTNAPTTPRLARWYWPSSPAPSAAPPDEAAPWGESICSTPAS